MNIFWFRRDLRIEDNIGLAEALSSNSATQPIFIFDENIIEDLPKDDARISFIHEQLRKISNELKSHGSSLLVLKGNPKDVFAQLIGNRHIDQLFFNRDYEPYAIQRDKEIEELMASNGISAHSFKDHVIFEPNEVLKMDGNPYTVYTPYKNKWTEKFKQIVTNLEENKIVDYAKFYQEQFEFPSLESLGFIKSEISVRPFDLNVVSSYHLSRDYPNLDSTSHLGPHLRFGTISIRSIIRKLNGNYGELNSFLNELIWREFFIQILFHFPKVVTNNFRSKYDSVKWRNNEKEFNRWCEGKTGYPIVDAGMRQLNATGTMHNRVRMVVASFLCKHLLIDWRWGEAYFAEKLLDYELASNNGNWQWAAGTGCDAAPYFRVFNPAEQTKKFDSNLIYIKKWVPEFQSFEYPEPIVDHKFARERAISAYKSGLAN